MTITRSTPYYLTLATVALLTLVLTGCSPHPPAPKTTHAVLRQVNHEHSRWKV